jgi:hypothetical protein
LHANNRLEIATFFQLNKYLIFIAKLLRLIALRNIHIHKVDGESLNIYIF